MARILTVALFVLAGLAFGGVVHLFDIGGFAWAAFGVASLLCESLWAGISLTRRSKE